MLHMLCFDVLLIQTPFFDLVLHLGNSAIEAQPEGITWVIGTVKLKTYVGVKFCSCSIIRITSARLHRGYKCSTSGRIASHADASIRGALGFLSLLFKDPRDS